MKSKSLYGVLADVEQWNSDLENFQYSLFHLREWVESVSTPTLHPIYIDLYEGEIKIGKIAGLIILEKVWLYGKRLFFYSGPSLINDTPELAEHCLKALVNFAIQNRFSKFKHTPLDSKTQSNIHLKGIQKIPYYEYIINFSAGYENFKPGQDLKKKLRLAAAANTEFHKSKSPLKDLDLMVNMLNKTKLLRINRDRKNYNIFSLQYVNKNTIQNLIKSGKGVIYHSLNDNEKHCVTLCFEHINQAYGIYISTDEFGYKNGITAFIATELSKLYQSNGFKYFNLGASIDDKEDDTHLANFKIKLGCIKQQVSTCYTDFLIFPQTLIDKINKAEKKLPKNSLTRTIKRFLR